MTIQLIAEVPQLDLSVPADGTIPLEIQAVNAAGTPDVGANGPATVLLNGKVVAYAQLNQGTASVDLQATATPGQDTIQVRSGKLLSGNVEVTVNPGLSDASELFDIVTNGTGGVVETLEKLIEEAEPKTVEGFFEKAVEELEKPGSILGATAKVLTILPLAKDLGLLGHLSTQPATELNQEQFQDAFSDAVKETLGLGVKTGAGLILETNPVGAVGSLVLNSAIDKGTEAIYNRTLKAGFKTVGANYYRSLKGLGTSPLTEPGVSNNPAAGDPPPSIVVVNPSGLASVGQNLSVAGQDVFAQAGAAYQGVVANFLDATGNTNPGAYAAYISWGDGNFTRGTVASLGGGGFQVSGGDSYVSPGIYSVNVAVISIDGSASSTYAGAVVANAAPIASTPAPVVNVMAPAIGTENADWESPYTFAVAYQDLAKVSAASLAGTTIRVQPPSGPSIAAQVIGLKILGATDTRGDGSTIVVTYQFSPPGGNWYAALREHTRSSWAGRRPPTSPATRRLRGRSGRSWRRSRRSST